MSRFAKFAGVAGPVMVAVFLTSCRQEPDPGITEKVDLLEAEIRDRDAQIAALQSEANSASASTTVSEAPAAPDLDAARAAYLGFVESVRVKLTEDMPDATFDRTSVFPVDGPDSARPILSKVAFRIVGKDGRAGEIVIPLSASATGEWEMPDTGKIASNFKAIPASKPASQPAAQPAAEARPKPVDVMGAGRTVEVQWPEDKRPAGKPAAPMQPAAPSQPTAPAKPKLPKKVMPTSRDVIIDFE